MRGHLRMMCRWTGVVVFCALVGLGSGAVDAKEKRPKGKKKEKAEKTRTKPTPLKAKGTLSVTKDEKGKVTDVTFASDDGKRYGVMIGRSGSKFSKMDGKAVEVAGFVVEKDGTTQLKISRCKEIKEKAAEGGEKPEKTKKGKKKAGDEGEAE